jgi:hypothetical protein
MHRIALAVLVASTSLAAANKPTGLVVTDTDLQVQMAYSHKQSPGGINKTVVQTVSFWLWGKSDGTDKLAVTLYEGSKKLKTITCPTPEISEDDGMSRADCNVEGVQFAPGAHSVEIALRSAETQKTRPLRTFTFSVFNSKQNGLDVEKAWYIDYDQRVGEHFGYWDETLHVKSWVKLAGKPDSSPGKMKCKANGKPVTEDSFTTLGQGQDQFDASGKTEFWQGYIGGTVSVQKDKAAAGKWECNMIFDGKVVRTFKFELDDKKNFIASSAQKDGKLVHPSTYLPDTVIPPGVDAKYTKSTKWWGKAI